MIKIKNILLLIIISLNACHAFAKKKPLVATLAPRTQTSLVIDAESGKILHNVNGNQKIYPASLTKMMTLYLTFEAVKKHKLKLTDKLPVSIHAERMLPGKLGLRSGQEITTKDAIMGLIVKSANDASVVLAEAIGTNETTFAVLMTKKAQALGMKNTKFCNSSGWHHPDQKTTAIDLAKLTIAIKRDFPEFYPLFKHDSFIYNGKTIMGHNRVTRNYAGAEGMKTGYTIPAGFNLVTTASRNGQRLIGVVTGSPSHASRDQKMMKLLDSHFSANNDVFAQTIANIKAGKIQPKKTPKKTVLAKAKIPNKKFASNKKLAKFPKKNAV